MDSQLARKLYLEHATAMAYIDVEQQNGDRNIGSAFHVGGGVFVTARHVVEGNKIVEIKMTEPVGVRAAEMFPGLTKEQTDEWDYALEERMGFIPLYKYWTEALELEHGPIYASDPQVDLAIFKVKNVHHAARFAKLGVHWDDWIYRYPWQLSEAIIFGYPPIPMTTEPYLVVAKAEVHTYVLLRHSPNVHFILSAMPRGGFSGGLAIHEDGFALGVITSGLSDGGKATELGFLAVLSIEPIRVLLESCNLLPQCQREYEEKLLGLRKTGN
jgi:trypsin-like peptidase